jgi:hypothetical protein
MNDEKSKKSSEAAPEHLIAAAGRAVKDALREHKLKCNPVATWKDGKVVWIPPEKIEI